MKVKVFDPIARQLELAIVEADLSNAVVEHYRSQYNNLRAKATRLALAKRNERTTLEKQLATASLHNRLLLVVLGELMVIAAWGLR